MDNAQLAAYLERLNYQGTLTVSADTLAALHRAHLFHIAFENLDIALGRKIQLTEAYVLEKILIQRRGGFCYELNYAFALLLRTLGFEVHLLAAQVYGTDCYGPEFDHLLLRVQIAETRWIADVGFGDCFRSPLQIAGPTVQELNDYYRIESHDAQHVLLHSRAQQAQIDGFAEAKRTWQAQYRFEYIAYDISAFLPMAEFHQNSPDSHFTRKSICSIATAKGRITLTNGKLIQTVDSTRHESPVFTALAYRELLVQHFAMYLPPELDIAKLLAAT